MSIESIWDRYAAAWSLNAASRADELSACVAHDITYCDPNGVIEGRDALSRYMAVTGFFDPPGPGAAR